MKQFLSFVSDHVVQVSLLNAGIWLGVIDWTLKIAFGLPSAIYICLKIWDEYIKKNKSKTNELS